MHAMHACMHDPPTDITHQHAHREDGRVGLTLTRRWSSGGSGDDDIQGRSAFGGPSIGGGPSKAKPLDWLEEVRRKHYEVRQLQSSEEGRRLQVI